MGTEHYRRWVPALIIGLVLCLPVIAWLFGGTKEHHPPGSRPDPMGSKSTGSGQ